MAKPVSEALDFSSVIQLCLVRKNGVVWLSVSPPELEKAILVALPTPLLALFQNALVDVGSGFVAHAHLFIPAVVPEKTRVYNPNLN